MAQRVRQCPRICQPGPAAPASSAQRDSPLNGAGESLVNGSIHLADVLSLKLLDRGNVSSGRGTACPGCRMAMTYRLRQTSDALRELEAVI